MMANESILGNNNQNRKIIEWGCQYLSSHGYTLKSNVPEIIQNTPWSNVVRFATSQGYIYLKHTPSQLALEAPIIQILHDQFMANVPVVIAHNTQLNCFLMKDSGRSLRSILKQQFNKELIFKTIDQFTSLQLATANHVDVFINAGVPDWRLNKLPDLYRQLLTQKKLLIADGLSEKEISALEKHYFAVSKLCEELSSYSIVDTIVQPDFNDNNTLIDDVSQKITVIDLGEIVISHPFFSLLNFLQQMKKHHGLTDKDDTYLRIKNTCFKNFIKFSSEKKLLDAFTIAEILQIVYWALANYRLMIACGKENLMSFQHGRLSGSLKELMTTLQAAGY